MAKKKEKMQDAIDKAIEETPKSAEEALAEAGFDIDNWERASSEIWKPQEAGEYIIGEYIRSELMPDEMKERHMQGKDVSIHYLMDKETGMQISFVGGWMVDNAFKTCDIVKGDLVYAQYRGQKDTKSGNRVNSWDVRFKKQ